MPMREQELIDYISSNLHAGHEHLGIGDDCCIWQAQGEQCLSSDAIVAGSHFSETDEPQLIGRKAAAAALSDLAAMGAAPIGASLIYQYSDGWDDQAIIDGLIQELERHQCPLLGGDTIKGPCLSLGLSVWGQPTPGGRLLRRSGGSIGDVLVVSGELGGSLHSGRHLRPEPRILEGQWLAQQDYVHAMMDISDGLAADVPRLAKASGCGSLLMAGKLPVHDDVPQRSPRATHALCDGEDFELLFAIAADHWPQLYTEWPFQIRVSMVGMLTEADNLYEDEYGTVGPLTLHGFEH